MPLPITHKEFLQGKRVNDIRPEPETYIPTQADVGLFRNYLTENKVNTQDRAALQAAADDFKVKKPAYQFKAWAGSTYGNNAMSIMSDNRDLLKTATTQYKYNEQRQRNGLNAIQFYDMSFDPNLYDEDTNEYLSEFGKKNKRMPGVADMADFEKGLAEYKDKKHAPERYQQQYTSFLNELMPALYNARQEWMAQGGTEEDFDWESTIASTLAQEKYLDVAKNFKRPSENQEGYDLISAMIGSNKKDNPNAFTPNDLIRMYRNMAYQPAPIDPDRSINMVAAADPQYTNLTNEKDFEQYAKKGAELENSEGGIFGIGRKINNKVTYGRANLDKLAMASVNAQNSGANDAGELSMYRFMTDEEVDIYNYLLAKHGEAQADEYLTTLTETLNQRMGGSQAENIKGNAGLIGLQSFGGGMDQAISGMRQLTSKEALPISAAQFASQQTREDLSGAGRMAFDVGSAVGNMVPSILVSTMLGGGGIPAALASGVGAGTLGASSGGNSYADALREGYTPEQARAYAWVSGTLEGGLQYALGGISKLGGTATKAVTGKISSAIAKVVANPTALKALTAATRTVAGSAGEFTEEYLQEILNPVVRNITLNENNEFKFFTEEALYNGLLGALTAGLFEGVDVASETVPQLQQRLAVRSQTNQFKQAVQLVGLDESASQGAVEAYTQAVVSGNTKAASALQNAVNKTSAQLAEVDADFEVAQAEIKANLQASYDAAQLARETGDTKAIKAADAKYLSDFEVAKVRNNAVRLKAENRASEVRVFVTDTVNSVIEQLNSTIQQQREQGIIQANNTSVKGAQYGAGNDSNQVAGPAAEDAGRNSQGYNRTWPMAGEVGQGGQASPGGNAAAQPVHGFKRINPADDGGSGGGFTGGAERGIAGERKTPVIRGLQATPESEYAIIRRAQAIEQSTGTRPDIRIVNEVDEATAEKIDILEDVTGRRVFLYESNDNYGDAWTENRDIFVRTNGNADIAFAFGHEAAHDNKQITAAGMEAIKSILERNPDLLSQYEAYRNAHITSPDEADIKRELVADAYGLYMAELAGNAEIQTTLGLKGSELNEIYSAFEQAELARGIDELPDVVKPAQGPKNAEYSRITFDDGYGNQLSYSMPDIKQKKNGIFYADFEVAGQKYHLEDTYKADLEDEIMRIKQESANNNAPRPALDRREALKLYRQGVTVPQYYSNGGKSASVALNLRDINLKNGIAQGGALPETELRQIGQNVNRWSEHGGWWGRIARAVGISESLGANAWYAITTPVRVLEALGNWRPTNQPGARAMNTLEGDTLRNTYWAYVHEQGGLANRWADGWRKKVAAVYDGKQSTSTLAQLLGENLLSEQDASRALYDKKNIVVRNALGTFVFDKRGQLTALSSGGQTLLFDENYYKQLQYAKKMVAQTAQQRPKNTSQEAYLASIRDAEQKYMARAKPISVKGDITLYESGNSITASTPNGALLANIKDGSRPDMKAVIGLKDVLVDFYQKSLPDQSGSLTENGYKPIPERQYYFPHQKRESHGIQDFLETLLGEDQCLPTSIAGLTSTFTPGKPFITHMLERIGDQTEYDAVRGFNRYVQAAADLIFYTPTIQRVRQLERFTREESEGSKNSSLAYWLHGYGNSLANKKSDLDRGFENFFGREVYTISDRLTKMFGAASVAGSASSALSNMIGFLTAVPGVEQGRVIPAVRDTLLNGIAALNGQYDGFSDKIPELVRRFGGYEDILTTREQKIKHQISKILGFGFDLVDRFSVESAARAKYAEFKGKGMAEAEAVRRTDEFLVKNFADRTKGEAPLLFTSKWLKPFAQFQLEALNQTQHFKDLGRQGIREQMDAIIGRNGGVVDKVDWTKPENQVKATTPKTLWRKVYYLVLMSLWGELTRELMGRDQTINPYGTIKDLSDPDKTVMQKAENIADQLPFASLLTGGGRVPLAGGTGDFSNALNDLLLNKDASKPDALRDLALATFSFIPGGAQVKKTYRGLTANAQGGYYTDDDRLRFPIVQEDKAKVALFGPSAAAPEGYDWQKDILSKSQTAAYKEAVKRDFSERLMYEFFLNLDNSGTKAGKLASIASFDSNKDGRPDFSAQQMKTLAGLLDVKLPKGVTVPGQAKKEADTYIKNKRKDKDTSPEDLAKAQALYDSWLEMLKTK